MSILATLLDTDVPVWPNGPGSIGPVVRIDRIMASGPEPVASHVADAGSSDHRPVVADLWFEVAR